MKFKYLIARETTEKLNLIELCYFEGTYSEKEANDKIDKWLNADTYLSKTCTNRKLFPYIYKVKD